MSSEPRRRGLLFVVSAPSGTGKTTVVERLVQVVPDLGLSRSYTSRAARTGETDGVDYNFITRQRFEEMVVADAFLEWADVFGNLYGTCADDAEREISAGRDLVLVIDVQGARKVRAHGLPMIGIFVLPPSFEILEQRLRGRSQDTEEQIRRRLNKACDEVNEFEQYEYVVVNDELAAAVDRLRAVILAERARVKAMRGAAAGILRTFEGK
jgi:guanylate kinase